MGKFFSGLVTDKNEILFFNKQQRELISQKKLKDRYGNFIFDADSHSSICAFYFENPYHEDACNKIEFDPFTKKVFCKTWVFPVDENKVVDLLLNEVNVYSLAEEIDFSIKPFVFVNYSNLEVKNFIEKNEKLMIRCLKKFKQIDKNISGYYNVTRLNKVWDDKMFELVHDDILVPSTRTLESAFMTDDLKLNNAYSYSLRNYLMIAIMTQCFEKNMLDNNENEIDTTDFQFLAKNGFVIACDGNEYDLYANVDGYVKKVLTLEE